MKQKSLATDRIRMNKGCIRVLSAFHPWLPPHFVSFEISWLPARSFRSCACAAVVHKSATRRIPTRLLLPSCLAPTAVLLGFYSDPTPVLPRKNLEKLGESRNFQIQEIFRGKNIRDVHRWPHYKMCRRTTATLPITHTFRRAQIPTQGWLFSISP